MAKKLVTLTEAEEQVDRLRERARLEEALVLERDRVPGLERVVEKRRTRVAELEAHVEVLAGRRDVMQAELTEVEARLAAVQVQVDERHVTGRKPVVDWSAHEADCRRRVDLIAALVVVEGGDPRGTLLDDLHGQTMMAGTRLRLEEEQSQVFRIEAELAVVRDSVQHVEAQLATI